MDVKPVGGHAGLPGVAHLRYDSPGNCLFNIGVVEHDKRSIASKFHGELKKIACTLPEEILSHFGGPREGKFAQARVVYNGVDYRARI